MANEKQVPLPLTGQEIKDAVIYKLYESMTKTCHLSDTAAYSAFKATVNIKLTLYDFGREVMDNHAITEQQGTPPDDVEDKNFQDVSFEIPVQPPNQVRAETNQEIPVKVTEGDKTVIRKVKYQARKK